MVRQRVFRSSLFMRPVERSETGLVGACQPSKTSCWSFGDGADSGLEGNEGI
jgi:hypothetical protein